MNTALIWTVLGLMIGWALHWLLDFFFWRNRRVCTDYEQELETTIGSLRQENTSLSSDVTALNARVGRTSELETALEKQKTEYNGLLADFNTRGHEMNTLRADFEARGVEIAGFQSANTRLGELEGQLAQRDTAIAKMNADFEARGAELSGYKARLNDKDAELVTLNAQLAEIDTELDGLGLGAAAAGGALAGGGLMASLRGRLGGLRSRISGDADGDIQPDVDGQLSAEVARLSAELTARDAKVSELEGKLSLQQDSMATIAPVQDVQIMQLQLEERDSELADLRASLDTRNSELAELNAELGGGDIDLSSAGIAAGGVAAAGGLLASLRGSMASKDDEIARLQAQVGSLSADLESSQQASSASDDFSIQLAENQAQIAALQADISNRDGEMADLRAVLDARTSELTEINAELGGGDNDLASAGLMAGAAAAGGGLLAKLRSLRGDLSNKDADLTARESEISILQARIAEFESQRTPDDLTKIWGVGPKIASVLNENGITTFDQLADADLDVINKMLADSGGNFTLATQDIRETWHDQAVYAAEDDWAHLNEVVENLKHTEGKGSLTKIWGVGAKVIGLLEADGIASYQDLVTADTDKIEDALHAAQGYYPGFTHERIHHAWIEQAQLASQNKWAQLRGYKQRFRRRRRHDDLTLIWGIGPVIDRVLNRRNIISFAHLARTSPDEIDAILQEAGARFSLSTEHLHESWTHQARLADAGEWQALEIYKDGLTWSNVQDDE